MISEPLAQQVGCSVVSLRKFERGAQRPSRRLTELLAQHQPSPPEERASFVQFARQVIDAKPPKVAIENSDIPIAIQEAHYR